MKFRKPVSKHKGARAFSHETHRTHPKNMLMGVRRGGIRL